MPEVKHDLDTNFLATVKINKKADNINKKADNINKKADDAGKTIQLLKDNDLKNIQQRLETIEARGSTIDPGTVLWQGKTSGGNIRLPSLIRPDFSNLPNGIVIEGIPISTSTDISLLNFDEFPFRFSKNDIVLNKEYTFNTHVAGLEINFKPGVSTIMKEDGYIKVTFVDSKNINIDILDPTYDTVNAVSSFLIAVSKVSVF